MVQFDSDTGDFAAFRRVMEGRYSCRAFRADPVPRPVIEALLMAAQRTASWCNSQPWQAVVVSGAALRRLSQALFSAAGEGEPEAPDIAFPSVYEGPYRDRRRACGFALYESVGIARDDRAASRKQMLENFRFFGAPHTVVVTAEASLGPYALVDCGGYVANLLNAAQALGLGAVPQAAVAGYSGIIRSALDLPERQRVLCAVSFGYADTDHPVNGFRTARASLDEAVRFAED